MKANELIIGDLVLVQDAPNAEFKPCIVTIGLLHDLLVINETKRSVMPIPLTASILYRNGFKIDGYAVLEIDKETHLEYYFPEHRLRKVWRGIDEWDNHAEKTEITFQCQCFYVHELQHALRLIGIEKEIVL